jgi:hypothetical protein
MTTSFITINEEINALMQACAARSFKSKDSLNQLHIAYSRLRNIRKGIVLQHPQFPGDLSLSSIIDEIEKVTGVTKDKKLQEWTFDHYNDLFKFKAEDLQRDIQKLNVPSQVGVR